jgi:hypothetical protein
MCSIESFRELLGAKEDEDNKIHVKHVSTMEAWRFESIRLDTMKRHKVALCMQAQGMMNKQQCLTLMPFPLPLLCIPIILTLHAFYQSCLTFLVKGYLSMLGTTILFVTSTFITHGVR